MAWTQTDLDALCSAIGQGAKEVQYSDKRVVYRSLAEMNELKRTMEQEINGSITPRRGRRITDFTIE